MSREIQRGITYSTGAANSTWPARPTNPTNAAYAAMVQSVDESVGKVMAALDESKLTDEQIINAVRKKGYTAIAA